MNIQSANALEGEDGALQPSADRATAASQSNPQAVSSKAGIPSAGDGDSYRMAPEFKRFLAAVGPLERALVAWDIARDAFVPSDLDDDADYEVWQGDDMVAGCCGPRRQSLAEAVHYAVVYQTDDSPCVIREVSRRDVGPEEAHRLLAQATGAA